MILSDTIDYYHFENEKIKDILLCCDSTKGYVFTLNLTTKQLNTCDNLKRISLLNELEDQIFIYWDNWAVNHDVYEGTIEISDFSAESIDKMPRKRTISNTGLEQNAQVFNFDKDKFLIVEINQFFSYKIRLINMNPPQEVVKYIEGANPKVDALCDNKKLLFLIPHKQNTYNRSSFFLDIDNLFMSSNWTLSKADVKGIYDFTAKRLETEVTPPKDSKELEAKAIKAKQKEYLKEIFGHNRQMNKSTRQAQKKNY